MTHAIYYFTSAYLAGTFIVVCVADFVIALDIETLAYWVYGLLLAAYPLFVIYEPSHLGAGKEEICSSAAKSDLTNIRSFRKLGYGGFGGAIADFHLYTDGRSLYGTMGIINSWLYFLSCLPMVVIFVELVNFVKSRLNINHHPDLTERNLEREAAQLQIALGEIERVVVKQRNNLTVPYERISFFLPIIGIFAIRLHRTKVTLDLSSGKKYKLYFFSIGDSTIFIETLRGLTDAPVKLESSSFWSDFRDYILTATTFFTIQLLILYLMIAHIADCVADPSLIVREFGVFVVVFFGFILPLTIKIFDRRLTWQTNYRYVLWRTTK